MKLRRGKLVWIVAGAALLLVAFFVFAVRSSNGPDFAFLEGAEFVDYDAGTVYLIFSCGTPATTAPWTHWRFEVPQDFDSFQKEVRRSLDDAEWQPVLGFDERIVEFKSNAGERITITDEPTDDRCTFYYSRESEISDYIGGWLWKVTHPHDPI
jgi:hypothetical protein